MAEDANARIRVDIDTAAALANIKNLQRQISAFHTSMAKGGAAAAATSLNMQQGLLNSINQTGKFSATIRNVKSTTDSFTDSLQKNKLSMGEYFRYAGASTKTFGSLFRTEFDTINKVARERVKDLQTQYIKMGRDANGAMRAIAVRPLALDMENLSTKTQIAAQRQALLNQLLKQGSTNLLNFGKNTQWAGRQLMVGFTVPLVMLGSVAAKTFMDMERQAVRFKRVYGELFTTGEETNKALAEIKELANEFTRYGVAVAKTMELAADIAATGKMGAELTAQVAETTRLAVLGGVEQAEALQATISLTDAFGVSAEGLAEKIDFLNAVENQTITSIEDLTIAIPKAGPVVRQLGGDVEDLTFFLTAMREGGINASEGANALKSGLASLINPTRQASEMLQGFGININGIVEGNAGDVKGLVIDFATALDGLDPLNRARAIEQLFGKFQFSRLSTLFQNVIKEGNQASRVLALTNASTAELAILSEREMKRIEDSPMFKFQKAIEDIKVTLVPLGEAFLKAVTPILEFGTRILKKFDELDEGAKGFVVGLTAIAGVIGPVFLMGFGLVANGVANVIKMFAFFKSSLNKAGTASTQLGMQTDYMTQQQLEAAAVAASLDQIHQKLRQTFTSEAAAVNALTAAYNRSIAAQGAMTGGVVGRTRPGMRLASGIMSVPGPRGAGDVVPAMLSPGEAVIPARQSRKYSGIISSLIADNVPGFRIGRNPFASMLGRSKVAVRMKDQDFISELRQSGKNARYKSAFETNTGADYLNRSGSINEKQKMARSSFERDMLGLDPKTTLPSARPTYGYARTPILSSFVNRLFGLKGKNFNAVTTGTRESRFMDLYGNINLITKNSVAKRSTASAGDSFTNYVRQRESTEAFGRNPVRWADDPWKKYSGSFASMRGASKDDLQGFDRFKDRFGQYKLPGTNTYTTNSAPQYVETQTPGGFAFSEIDKIIVNNPGIAKRLKAELRAAGLGGVRVTGSNFVERLFKQMGVPGYDGGTDSVPDAALKEFDQFRKKEISDLGDKLRATPEGEFKKAYEGISYPGAPKMSEAAQQRYIDQARARGVSETRIQQALETYKSRAVGPERTLLEARQLFEQRATADNVPQGSMNSVLNRPSTQNSHIRKETRPVLIDGQIIDVKDWRGRNVFKESTDINQFHQAMDQMLARDAKGNTIPDKTFFQNLDAKEIARMSGLSEKQAQREINKLIRGDHPTTKNATKAFLAVAEKYTQIPGSKSRFARFDAVKHIMNGRLKDRMFFDAVNNGTLQIPKMSRPSIDASGLRKQNDLIASKSGQIADARSRIIGPTEGIAKPSNVQRTGGNARDNRLSLLSKGETVLTNETTNNLKKGGSSLIPGIGAIQARGKFAPIRVPGSYEGIPEGQVQQDAPTRQQARDPVTGRFVSSKAPAAPAPTSRFAGMGGKVAAGASFAGMGAMMYGMSGGPGADMAMMASMPLMMAPMLQPLMSLFKSPWAAAAVAIAAVVTSVILLRNTFNDAQKEALRTAETLGSSTEAMKKLADFAGTVSSGEIMDRVREDRLKLVTRGTGKTTFGEAFVQTEEGKATLEVAAKQLATGGSDSVINSLTAQLATAVVSGVLTPEQARSMAANLAYELGDMKIGIQVSANIVELVGPGGQDLTGGNIVEFAGKMSERSMESISGQMEMLEKNTSTSYLGSQTQRDVGMGGMVAAGAGVGAGIGALVAGPVGAAVGTVIGAVAGAVGGFNLLQEETKKLGAMSGAVVGEMINGLEAQREISSALDVYYMKKIEEAKVQGDITEQLRLQAEYEGEKKALSEIEIQNRDQIRQALEAGGPAADSTRLGIENAIQTRFKDDATAQISLAPAKTTLDRLQSSNLISQVDKDIINLELATTMDPTALNSLLMFVGEDEAKIDALVNIIGKYGGDFASEAQNVLNLVENDNLKSEFFVKISQSGNKVEAQKTMDFVREIGKQGGVFETDVILKYYSDDPEAQAELQRIFEAVETQGVTTVEQAYAINPKLDNPEAFDEEFFNMLNEGDREQYVKTVSMFLEMDNIEVTTSDDFDKWTMDEGARFGPYPGGEHSEAAWQRFYAEDQGSKVVNEMPSTDPTLDPGDEDSGGGGSGPAASSLDDILKKLRDIRKNQIGVAKGFEASAAGINKLFGGGSGINLFSGIENDMRRLGAEEDLISLIVGMSPEDFEKQKNTLFNFDKQTGEIIGFKDQLQSIGRALSAIALGQYVSDQQRSAKESRNQVLAFNQLRAAGYSVAEAYETIQDAAVASAIATGNVTRDQLNTMLSELRNAQAAMKEAARLTPEGLQEVFEEGFSKAMESFDVKERKLTLDYEFKIKNDQALIDQAQNQIALIQYEIDDYEADLSRIQNQEDDINKTYDTKLEALEKVRAANQKILDQEKGKLSVAEAITRGDLAAAARAAQDVRATSASGYFSSQADALDASRQSALDAVRGKSGLSRIEIEEQIKELAENIFNIEEDTLEPANERIRLAGIELQSRIDELEVLGKTRAKWEEIKVGIDLARVGSIGYKEAMEEALGVVQDVLDAWNGIQSKTVTLTTIQQTIRDGITPPPAPGGGFTGTGSQPGPTYPTTGPTVHRVPGPTAPAAGSSASNPIVPPGILPGMSVPKGEGNRFGGAVITAAVGQYVRVPAGFYMYANSWHPTLPGKVQLEFGNKPNLINGKAVMTTGKTVLIGTGYDGKNTVVTPSLDKFAAGGYISGPGTPTSDSIPAMLSDGEYVIKASSVGKFGTEFLDSVNSGKLPKFKVGGMVRDGGRSSKSTPAKPVSRVSADAAERRALAAKPATPFQNFEAGFNNIMASVAANPIVQSIGNTINNSPALKSLLAVVSTPVEIMGALAKNYVTTAAVSMNKLRQGDFIGAAGTVATNALTSLPMSVMQGSANAFAGVLDSNNAKPSMFEQANQAAYDANLFNAQNNPEMAALGRIIGGSLNIAADPLTYLGIGAITKSFGFARNIAKSVDTPTSDLGVTPGKLDLGTDRSGEEALSVPAYQIGSNKPIVFQGPGQDFSEFAGSAVSVVNPTPIGFIEEALKILSPGHSLVPGLKSMRDNFKNNNIGPEENEFLTQMQGSAIFNDLGMLSKGDLGGLATFITSLAGDARAISIVKNNAESLVELQRNNMNKITAEASIFDPSVIRSLGEFGQEVADISNVAAFRSLGNFKVVRQANGDILLDPAGNFLDGVARSSLHWATGGPIRDHFYGGFGGVGTTKIVAGLKELIDDNGLPYNMYTNDTFWGVNPGEQLRVSNGILATSNLPESHLAELLKRGLIEPGQTAPPIVWDDAMKEVLYELRENYTDADILRLKEDYNINTLPEYAARKIEEEALSMAASAINKDPVIRLLDKDTTGDAKFNAGMANLATQLGIRKMLHSDTQMGRNEYLDPTIKKPEFSPRSIHEYPDFDSLEALRHEALKGYFISPINKEYIGQGLAKGGLVKPKLFANGGFVSQGTDTVPSMLTPGEFVVKRPMVNKYGTDFLEGINSGSLSSVQSMSSPSFSSGSSSVSVNQSSVPSRQAAASSSNSVYNYSLSVNVASQSDPNTIAQTVMNQLRMVDSQRVRSNRF